MSVDAMEASEFAEGTPGYSAAVCEDDFWKCVMDKHASVSKSDMLWATEEQKRRKRIMESK